jgi:tetratricopeptide (TPR) repeat protein
VAELERRVSANGSRSALKSLGAAELAEAKALAKADPTCLMPLALLHRDLSRGYAVRRQGQLSSHAREIAITYAEMLAKKQPHAGYSEGLMVNFAADLAQAGASSAARDLLEHALRINPGYLPALLSLGFSFERNADYLEAADVYKKLVETHPDFDEGRLRLGMNLIRTGREEAGEVLLQPLVERGARPWIQAVAAQELVRQKAEKRNNLPEAEGEARAALERMPEDQRLWILLAVILERLDRHEEAVAVLSDLPQASRGISPRARYGEWPALGLNASQAFLTGRAEEAIPDLKSALIARGGAR